MLDTITYDKLFLICFTLVAIMLVIGATIVGFQAAKAGGVPADKLLQTIAQNETGVRLATVLAVVSAAIALAIAGKLTEGVVALLSSVAGYVLGGLKARSAGEE